MTALLDQAIASVRDLPDDAQDAVARMLLDLVAEDPVELTAEEAASFEESLAQAERGEFASDEAVRAIWAKHGL
jgi:predicted transcriptional regulator